MFITNVTQEHKGDENLAGFFGFFDYSKPGLGVGKDEQQKHSFFVFFEIFFRKFWNLVLINLFYFISCLPFLIIGFISLYFKNYLLSFLFIFLFIATIGPATSGFTFIMRNLAREEHAFIWLDYKDTIKRNWKQSLAVSFINAIIFILVFISVQFYYENYISNSWYIIPFGIGISCSIIFMFMQYYLYVMIITFNLTLKQLYKNAFLFAFIGLLRNFLTTIVVIITALIAFFLPLITLSSVVAIFPLTLMFVPFIALSFLGLLINRAVWSLIKKYMIDPYNKENGINDKKDDLEPLFEDMGREKPIKKYLK
jgi:uncharacterized membrane protein YesL